MCVRACVCIDLLTCVYSDEGSSVTPEMLAISLLIVNQKTFASSRIQGYVNH